MTFGVGDALAARDPGAAARLGLTPATVLTGMADQALRRKRFDLAALAAGRALDQAPLDVSALRDRALALEGAGQSRRAAEVMAFAGKRGWRDNAVQAWLMREDLARGDYDMAYQRADSLARRRQSFRPMVFALGGLAAADPVQTEAFARRLATRPPWRSQFFEVLAATPQTDQAIERLLRSVEASSAPLLPEELAGWVDRLVLEGRYNDAQQALRTFAAGRGALARIRDGGFEPTPGPTPFAWTGLGLGGADYVTGPAPGRTGQAAYVTYDGFTGGDIVRRLVVVSPGVHRLVGEARGEAGEVSRLRWEARCVDSETPLAAVETKAAPGVWTPFEAAFVTPPEGCPAIWLALAGVPEGRRSSISAWFDHVTIAPAG